MTALALTTHAAEVRARFDAFEASLRTSYSHAVELGRALLEAKAGLPHGEFGRLFRDHADPVEPPLPFSQRWAQMLMQVAASPALADPKHASLLPTDVPSLCALSRLEPDELEAAIARGDVRADMRRGEARAVAHRTRFTGNDEWYTPAEHIERARRVLGAFDLDPASNDIAQQSVQAAEYYTAEDDGLAHEWHGRVWLNPPYSQPLIEQFVRKLVAEVQAGNVSEAILLTHNFSDTRWFHHAFDAASAVCLTRGRIRFESPSRDLASPTQGSAFFYYGANVERFAAVFAEVGALAMRLPDCAADPKERLQALCDAFAADLLGALERDGRLRSRAIANLDVLLQQVSATGGAA